MEDFLFIIVGCGGIGGNVIRDLPKLLDQFKHRVVLVDGDKVEKKNCSRQPFQAQDVGLNKARALARKINSFYPIKCLYLDKYISNLELDVVIEKYGKNKIPYLIGCVDNDATRKIIENTFEHYPDAVLLDGANEKYEGNVFCCYRKAGVQHGKKRSDVYSLKEDVNPAQIGCEEQVAKGELQFLITNNKVASAMLEYIYASIISKFGSKDFPKGVTKIERFKTFYY